MLKKNDTIQCGELLFKLIDEEIQLELKRRIQVIMSVSKINVSHSTTTFKVNLGRLAGHTYAACKLANEYKNTTVVVATNDEVDKLRTDGHIVEASTLLTGDKKYRELMRNDLVIVDGFARCNISEEQLTSTFPEMQFLILLQ